MVQRHEVTLEVHVDHRVPILFAEVNEHAVTQDARVVDQYVQVTERVKSTLHQSFAAVPRRDIVVVRQRLAAHGPNLRHNFLGRCGLTRGSVESTSEVVHDDLGTLRGEK